MDVATALATQGFGTFQKTQIRLPDGALKAVGEYPVQVALHADVVADITVVVQGEMA
jgi:large subunit ribosomal protein L9